MKYKYLLFTLFLFISNNALASINNQNVLDNVLDKYKAVASTWQNVLMDNALWLFWCLVTISMVFSFGLMLLKQVDLSEFFAELIKFFMFTGFYLWLLRNAPEFGSAIIKSLGTLAARAAGVSDTPSPSSIVDIGFAIFDKILSQGSVWSPIDSAMGILIGLIILVVIALVAINMLLLLITSWVLLYAGIFLLGFGGSKWTSDIAINYYKTLLSISIQIFTMVLLVGIGKSFVDEYYNAMSDKLYFSELAVMLIVSIILLYLTNKVPPLMSGIITGSSIGGGIGNFSAGAIVGASATAAAGMGVAKEALTSGATSVKNLMEAFKGTSGGEGEGMNSESDQSSGDTAGDTASESPLSSAMGDSDGSLSAGDSDNSGTESSESSSSAGGQSSGTESSESSSSAGGQSSGTESSESSSSAGSQSSGTESSGSSSSAGSQSSGTESSESSSSAGSQSSGTDNPTIVEKPKSATSLVKQAFRDKGDK